MSKPMILVSCDEHTGPPTEHYRQYLPKKFHERLDEWEAMSRGFFESLWQLAHIRPHQFPVADNEGALGNGGLDGAWQPERRLEEMDREGIVLGIANPNANDTRRFHMPPFPSPAFDFAGNFGKFTPAEMMAGARAHNRWLADFREATDGRVEGSALPGPLLDLDDTVRELEWLGEHAFHIMAIPVPPLDDRYDRVWAACQDLGLVLNAHAGHSGSGSMTKLSDFKPKLPRTQVEAALGRARAAAVKAGIDPTELEERELLALLANRSDPDADFANVDGEVLAESNGKGTFDLNEGDRAPLWQLMLSGVLDRFPGLKVTFSEIRSDWLPATIGCLDRRLPQLSSSLELKPSEYYQRNFHVAASFIRPLEVQMRHEIGVHQLMFSRDYPHPEGTWPNTHNWIRAAFAGVPEDEARLILGENAVDWFGFDRDKLAKIAARIGPRPEDLLGEHQVPREKLEYFQLTSNFNRPLIPLNVPALESELTERPLGEFVPFGTDFAMTLET
jgi:predicted TIM-barrel fold metal-dependent hydrolase